jgi:PEGA domain
MRDLCLFRLLLVPLLLIAATAHAQSPPTTSAPAAAVPSPPSPQDAAEAKRRFTAGLKLYGEHAYTEALAEFEASYRLGRRPSALRNLAQCHRDMRHFAEAYEAYDRLLKVHASQLSAADREAIGHALDELSELSGSVRVTSNETGANVTFDGVSLGMTPLRADTRVSLASHHIVLTKAGFEPFEKDVTIQSNQSVTVDATLVPESTTGHVTVREENGDPVDVFIDGEDKGAAPWEGDLPPGDHIVEVKGTKFAAEKRPFTLAKKQRLDLALDATTTLGHIRVTTVPASAAITFDGESVGTGVWDADAAPGSHRIMVAMEGFPHAERVVNLARGQVLVLDLPLATAGANVPVYRGFFTRINAFFLVSPNKASVYPYPSAGYSSFTNGGPGTGAHIGLGGALHIGYDFDPFAVEFVGAGFIDHYSLETPETSSTNNTSQGSNSGDVTGVDTFLGAAGRVTSHGATVRGTAALAPGVLIHIVNVNDGFTNNEGAGTGPCNSSLNNCSKSTSGGSGQGSVGYAAPAFMFDGGMLVGNSPGAKFFLGVVALVDFAPTLYWGPDGQAPFPASDLYPGRGLKAISGIQFYVGPSLGLQFGH